MTLVTLPYWEYWDISNLIQIQILSFISLKIELNNGSKYYSNITLWTGSHETARTSSGKYCLRGIQCEQFSLLCYPSRFWLKANRGLSPLLSCSYSVSGSGCSESHGTDSLSRRSIICHWQHPRSSRSKLNARTHRSLWDWRWGWCAWTTKILVAWIICRGSFSWGLVCRWSWALIDSGIVWICSGTRYQPLQGKSDGRGILSGVCQEWWEIGNAIWKIPNGVMLLLWSTRLTNGRWTRAYNSIVFETILWTSPLPLISSPSIQYAPQFYTRLK